ncbi:MAG: dihydrodipicolinate synthase family protein [Thermodesulfobacteriota bacterium]|nr:dihydrodipicolinate synthase family protein [Thermodesulfobacteriota bacterium]
MAADTNQIPRGLVCPLVTPLKSGDQVDLSALDRLIDHAGAGVDAFLLGDVFWGEGLVLSPDTRLEMVSAALKIIQGKWPVLITITSHSMKATHELLTRVEAFVEGWGYGGKLFWVDYPVYYHSNRGLPQWYMTVSRDTSRGFILGNHAGLVDRRKRPVKHKNIRTSVLKKMSQIDQVRGLIFTGSLKRSMDYHRAVRLRRGFKFYDGDEMAFVRQPSSDGVVAGGANLLPEAWRDMTGSCLNQYDVQQQYADHTSQVLEMGVMLQAFHDIYSQNPASLMKQMLHVAGVLPNARTALKTPPATQTQKRTAEAMCRKYDLI